MATINGIKKPSCDLAIIRSNNKGKYIAKWRNPNIGEKVQYYGYSGFTAMPVSSEGQISQDILIDTTWNKKDCINRF